MIESNGRPGLRWATLASLCALALLAPAASGFGVGAGPALAQEGASAVQDVTLDDVVLPLGTTSLKARRVTVSGTRLSKGDLLAILKAEGGEPWPARLARLDAASLSIPELRVEHADGPKRQTVIYRDVVARDVRAGRIAELTSSGAAVAVEGDAQAGSGSYGRLQASEFDLPALARLYTEPGDGKGALQRLYAAFSVEDLAFTDERGTIVKLARLGGRDLAGRQTPTTWTGAMEAFGAVDLDKAEPAERARLTGIAADLAEAISIGSLEATGLTVQETKGDAPIQLGIGRLAYLGSGAEAGVTLADITFAGPGTRTRIGRLSLTGFSLTPTIETLRRLSANPDKLDAELRRLTPIIGTLALGDLSVELPPEAPKAGDPLAPRTDGAAVHVGLRNAAMTFGPPRDGVPTASRLTLSGLTLPASAVAGVPGLGSLALYGYSDLDLSLVADTAWDEGSRELAVREVSVSGKDMGTLRVNGTLGGIGPEVFDPDSAVSGFAMLSATAKALDLTLENGGLFERFIAAQSKALSLKPEELRREYVTASVIGVPVILGNSAAAKAIGAAMGKFVAKPGTLSISAKVKNGSGLGVVDFSTAPTPAAVLDKLDVNAKAE